MDIDFIKWMCEKAGWEFMGNDYYFHVSVNTGRWVPNSEYDFLDVYYPLLLQRAIEGVNIDENILFSIETDWGNCVYLNIEGEDPDYPIHKNAILEQLCFDDGDDAKESALRYIYDQERSNA